MHSPLFNKQRVSQLINTSSERKWWTLQTLEQVPEEAFVCEHVGFKG